MIVKFFIEDLFLDLAKPICFIHLYLALVIPASQIDYFSCRYILLRFENYPVHIDMYKIFNYFKITSLKSAGFRLIYNIIHFFFYLIFRPILANSIRK